MNGINTKFTFRYKKERIGPWTWVLPISLCCIAIGFGILANLYPKIDMYREPKGVFGRTIDKLLLKVNLFEGKTLKFLKGCPKFG